MLDREWKLRALRRVLGRESFQRGDEFVFFCPKHSHHKPKLNINLRTDKVHCWVCGFKGGDLRPVLYMKGSTSDAEEYVRSRDRGSVEKESGGEVYDTPALPPDFRTLSCLQDPYRKAGFNYVRSRGLGFKDVLLYKLGFCADGRYKHRVIVPSFDSFGELNFFVGRKIYDDVPGTSYLHGNFDKDIVFNDYMIDWDSPITLVEGPFDAMVAGDDAIPLMGKILNEDSLLFRKIVTSGVPVTLAMDSDAHEAQLMIANSLLEHGVSISIAFVKSRGFKDVGEMTRRQFRELRDDAIRVDSSLSLMRARVMGMMS